MKGPVTTLIPVYDPKAILSASHITPLLKWITTSSSVHLAEGLLPCWSNHRGVPLLGIGLQILNLFLEVHVYKLLFTEMVGFLQSLQVSEILLVLNLCDMYLRVKGTVPLNLAVESGVFKVLDGL